MPARLDPAGIQPGTHDGDTAQTQDGKVAWVPGGTPIFLLEAGQTVAAYEVLHGITLPVPSIVLRKN